MNKKTRIEIIDRHTTLYFLNPKPAAADPLGFSGPVKYAELNGKLAHGFRLPYEELAGHTGKLLDNLFSQIPEENERPMKYWIWYLKRRPGLDDAWNESIPISATIQPWIDIEPPTGFPAKISIQPTVLLYPFGWSTWFSLLVSGDHQFSDLVSLIDHVFNGAAFTVSPSPKKLSLSTCFDLISTGIREDVFGGVLTKDQQDVNPALITTVLAQQQSARALTALSPDDQRELRTLVRPTGPAGQKPFQDLVSHLTSSDDVNYDRNYLVHDQLGRFIWLEKLLKPEGQNHMKLECYHHNTVRSLVQAWHFFGLIEYGADDGLFERWKKAQDAATAKKTATGDDDALPSLIGTAFNRLDNFKYQNASLQAFLDADSLKKQIEVSRAKAIASGLVSSASGGPPAKPAKP
jgi:hypothetical protein